MDWWVYPIIYMIFAAITGRVIYATFNFATVKTWEREYVQGHFYNIRAGSAEIYDKYSTHELSWLSLCYGLAWPIMIFWAVVRVGNKTKAERTSTGLQANQEKALELREREAKVTLLEKELGIK